MKKFLALILVLTMVLGLFSACTPESEPETVEVPTETTQTPEPTEETTVPREPIIPPLEEGADVLTYRYDETYLNMYYEKLEEYKQIALTGTDMAQLEALDPDMEELLQFLMDQESIATVLYYCDMDDEEASERHLELTDVMTEVQEKTIEMMREVYQSDSKLKEEIFADWTEEEIQQMLDYDSEIKELQQRNTEIEVEYQDMDDDQLENDIGKLYSELVSNYNRIAQIYGYDNYYQYAYTHVYSRDYTSEEVAQMREYAKQYLLPAFTAALTRFEENLQNLSSREMSRLSEFIYSDYDDVDYYEEYMEMLPEDVRADMETMFDGNVVFPKSRNAMDGAFTTVINNHPFCFFSRDNKDTCTIIHELGHYYGGLYGDLQMIPLDLAEIQSQGNEWLMIAGMKDELKENAYQCYLDYRFMQDMGTILICMIIDEFEEQVYSSENVENFTTKDFDRIMRQVCEGYGGISFINENLTDINYYWRMVTIEHPVYYVSYAMSLIPSLDLFFTADEDWDSALEIYLGLTRDVDMELTYLEVLEGAGLASPFDEDVYVALAQRYGVLEEESTEETQEAA